MSSFLIRPATLRDANAIAQIHAGFDPPAAADRSPADTANAPSRDKRRSLWRDAIEYGEPQVHVACLADEVVGFVGFDRCRDKGTPPTMGEIWAIYVARPHWDRGAGLALWDAAREGLLEEGCATVSVWIALGNDRALRFHELAGFKREMSTARTVPSGGVRIEEIRLKRKL